MAKSVVKSVVKMFDTISGQIFDRIVVKSGVKIFDIMSGQIFDHQGVGRGP